MQAEELTAESALPALSDFVERKGVGQGPRSRSTVWRCELTCKERSEPPNHNRVRCGARCSNLYADETVLRNVYCAAPETAGETSRLIDGQSDRQSGTCS